MAAAITTASPKAQCFRCHKPLDKVLECAKCHFAKYCGKECQTAAWKNGHKVECATRSLASLMKSISAETDQVYEEAKAFQEKSKFFAQTAGEKKASYLEAKNQGLPSEDLEKEADAYASVVSDHSEEGLALARAANLKIALQRKQIQEKITQLMALINS